MAEYEYKTKQQSNINLGETLKMTVKAPAIADRIFKTWVDADKYIKDECSSAIAGLSLVVIEDSNPALNGIYYVNYDVDEHGHPTQVLRLYRQGAVQSNWLEEDINSLAYIRNRPTTDYGTFTIGPNGEVTETPYADGYINYDMDTVLENNTLDM